MGNDLSLLANISGFNARMWADKGIEAQAKAQQQLSSGKKNSDPSDCPSDAAMGSELSSRIGLLEQLRANSMQSIPFIQWGAQLMGSSNEIMIRMSALAAQSNNGALSNNERGLLDKDFQNLLKQIELNSRTPWGSNLIPFNGTTEGVALQVGEGAENKIMIVLPNLSPDALQLSGIDILSQDTAQNSLKTLSGVMASLNEKIAEFGAIKDRLTHQARILSSSLINHSALKAEYTDADTAKALIDVERYKALTQVSFAMLQESFEKNRDLTQLIRSVMR